MTSQGDSLTRRKASGAVLLAAFAAGAVIGAIVLQAFRDGMSPVREVAEVSEPVLALIGEDTSEERQLARATTRWGDVPSVHSGPISGRVTAPVSHEPITAGVTVVEVDGIARPALVSASPLWRDLEVGLRGSDVAAAAELLETLEFGESLHGSDRVNSDFTEAVKRFETAYGWEPTGVFRPDYVVWVPVGPINPDNVDAGVGTLLEPETVLFTGTAPLLGARLESASPGGSLTPYGEDAVFEIPDEIVVPVSSELRVDSPEALESLANYILANPSTAPLLPAGATMGAGGSDPTFGVVRLATPRITQTVPTSSIIVSADGKTCVMDETEHVHHVTVTGGLGGVTEIAPTLDLALRIIANPGTNQDSC